MSWLLVWRVVLAASLAVVAINTAIAVYKTSRSAYQDWKTPRAVSSK